MQWLKSHILPGVLGAVMLGAAGLVLAQTATAPTQVFRAKLTALNNSSVSGEAIVSRQGDELTVITYAEGVEVGQSHPQHIHGFDDDRNATCPTLAQDSDGDHLVQVAEGQASYGPIQLPLKPFPMGQASAANPDGSASNPPRGDLTFVHTYSIGPNGDISDAALTPLANKLVVIHGMTVPAESNTYEPTLPIACGQLVALAQGAQDNGQNNGNNNGNNGGDNAGGNNRVVRVGSGGCAIWNGRGTAPGFDPLWVLLLFAGLVGLYRVRRRQRR